MKREEILSKYEPVRSNLLMILHEIQNNKPQQFISTDDIKEIAKYLKITYSQVYGVVTYYSMFSLKPRGKYVFRVCNSPICRMKGSNAIIKEFMTNLSIEIGDTTNDGLYTLETTECIGKCKSAPVMNINKDFLGSIKPEAIIDIIKTNK
jgi:NADH-quinone oxidoreductase subunit E